MRFFSDNAAAAHPKVIEAIAASNRVDTAYDGDAWSERLDGAFSELFETEVRAFWVTTGTAANCLALAALCPPYRGIICHRDAHIEVDEAGAPGILHRRREADAARRTRARSSRRRLSPPNATASARMFIRFSPPPSRSPMRPNTGSFTGPARSRRSGSWRRSGVSLCTWTARASPMRSRRLASGRLTSTWRAGVDVLCFGFTKNGGLNAEALILFRTELADEIAVRRKRAGHLLSKGRMLAAQILALLEDGLWLDNARAANAAAQTLAEAAGDRLDLSRRGQ